jgi:hypothetical protein
VLRGVRVELAALEQGKPHPVDADTLLPAQESAREAFQAWLALHARVGAEADRDKEAPLTSEDLAAWGALVDRAAALHKAAVAKAALLVRVVEGGGRLKWWA